MVPDDGERSPNAELLSAAYDELRALARRYMASERRSHTLQPTALVHEAWSRLEDSGRVSWAGRTHFFAAAATEMRRVLVEHARARSARKRGGGARRVLLEDSMAVTAGPSLEMLALDEALSALGERHERPARVAEMRLFAGMQFAEIADVVAVSDRTAKKDWQLARAWLARELRATT